LWLTSPHFYPTYGGAQNRYRSYIPGLLERGLDVQIMTGTPLLEERTESDSQADWYQAAPGEWLPASTLDGAPLERIRLPDSKKRSRTQIYYNALLDVCQRPSAGPVVAQLLTNIRPGAEPWLRKLKNNGIATVYSVSQYPAWPQKPFKRIFRRRGYQQVFNEFDALVTNSEAIREFLREIGVSTRIEYIPNGVKLDRFRPGRTEQETQARESLRQHFGIPQGHTVIVAVGAIMPRKSPDVVIRAWRKILSQQPNTHLLFVGPRTDTHDSKLKDFGREIADLIATSAAPEQVHFAGIVEDVENYLRAADIFILASKREGTPNSLLEAMAVGLPSLVTPFIGISASIGEAGRDFQLVERSPEAIAAALSAFLEDGSSAQRLAQAGHAYVTGNLDQQLSLDRYAEIYEELGALAARRLRG
jgi:glycosyltransferase involved in cell wall biosynthesis